MWSKHLPLVGLSHSGLRPNVVQTFAPQWRTLFATEFDHVWINNVLIIEKKPIQNKGILIVHQRGTKTAVSDYVAM
jgi:hypothetical protein